MRLPSLVAQACDPVLNTKDGGIKVVWKMVSADTNGLYNVAATDVFVCPRVVPAMARKSVRGLRCLIRAAQHIHISLHSPLV